LGFCVGGFLLAWVAFDLFENLADLQKKHLGAGDIAELYLVQTPEFLVQVLPVALLLALLYALTTHARHNELTAMRAAGISLWRLALPYFGVGLLASVALLLLNEFWVPDTARHAERIESRRLASLTASDPDVVRNFGFTNTRDRRTWQMGAYHQQFGTMSQVQVDWALPDGERRWLFAGRGHLTNGVWTFYEVKEFREDPATPGRLVPALHTNVLVLPEFSETLEEIRSEIKISRRLGPRTARGLDIPIAEIRDYLRLHPNPSRSDQNWLFTKMHGRLATPWTCVVVVLIALPFGARAGRRNVFVGVAGSIVICFAYFVFQQVALALGTGGYLPPWLAGWLPNAAFALLGITLIMRGR